MVKQKTNSGAKKRFRFTGAKKRKRKIMKESSCRRHRAFGKHPHQQENEYVHDSECKRVKRLLGCR